MGGGLTMSKPRKSINPTRRNFHVAGEATRVRSWPATSSITTYWGSLIPVARTIRVAAGIPIAIARIVSKSATPGCTEDEIYRVSTHHKRIVAADPHVPGPG